MSFRSTARERRRRSILPPSFFALMFAVLWTGVGARAFAQNVSIGTAAANNSALLHLESTAKGFLAPRMTNAQMLAITTPATGDIVYNTTAKTFFYYNGTIWTTFIGQGWSLTGDAGTSASINFLGTTDSIDLVQKTNNTEHLRDFASGPLGLTNTNNSAESLIFYEASGLGAKYVSFKAGTQPGTVHYIWPLTGDGTSNQCLVTDGAGNLSWHTFTTFGGGGSDTLWLRGKGTYAEYGVGTGNSAGGAYALAGGKYSSAGSTYSLAWGDSCSSSSTYTMTGGGYRNTSGKVATTTRGGAYNGEGDDHTYCGGGLDNSLGGSFDVVINGDSDITNGGGLVYNTVINGHHIKSGKAFELYYGDSITAATNGWNIIYKTAWSPMRLGIMTTAPTQAVDVVGNVRFSGGLSANGLMGTSGTTYLTSAGSVSPPTWSSLVVPSTSWRLTGNIGTNSATNFIGTTDANDFVIRTNALERVRVTSAGLVGVGISTPAHQLHSVSSATTDEAAAVYGNATGATTSQSISVWGRANNASSNTASISLLATGNGNTTSGTTNVSYQLSQGEFAMGRTTLAPSVGTVVEAATAGTAYSQQGPSGVIQLSMGTDLTSTPPVSGVYQDLGTVTINNEYIASTSIILAGVIQKINVGGSPDPKNSIYNVDVESRAAGSCVIRIGMTPFVTDTHNYPSSNYIRIGYVVINPGR